MPLPTAKILSNPTRHAWAQVHQFAPKDETKYALYGELIALVAYESLGEDAPSSAEVGKEILTRLHEEYFGKDEGTVYDKLVQSVAKLTEEFSGLDLTVAAAVFWKGYVYFAISGGGHVFLSRGGNLYPLFTKDSEEKSLSGKALAGDIFLLGTDQFFEVVDKSDLSASFTDKTSFADIADNLAPMVHQKNHGKAGALLFQVRKEDIVPKFQEEYQETLDTPKETIAKEEIDTYVNEIAKEEQPGGKTGIISHIKSKIIGLLTRLPDRYIKPTGEPASRRRSALLVGVIILVLLGVSITFGMKQKEERDYRMQYQNRLKEAQGLFDNALLQKDVNQMSSREMYINAKGIIDALVQEGFKDPEIDKLKGAISSQEQTILGRIQSQLSLFLDLSVVRSGVVAKQVVLGKNKIVVLDSGGSRLISTSTDKKETSVVGGEDKTPQASFIALYSDKSYVVTDKGIIEISKNGAIKTVITKDDEWQDIGGLGVFGGNIYILTKNGKIWRYPTVEAGFGTKQDWLAKDVSLDFSKVVDMVIDGSIWFLTSDGDVGKFTRGAKDVFRITGLDENLGEAGALYTDENLDSVFILDKGAGRIVEFDKKGAYKLQYVAQDTKDAVDFVVSKDAGKIFLLTETKILEIPLK